MTSFTTDKELKIAVNLWCSNKKYAIKKYDHISLWDTKKIKHMNSLFSNKTSFNEDLSNWDVSNVTDMSYMFGNSEL